jgi:hypothetical protein
LKISFGSGRNGYLKISFGYFFIFSFHFQYNMFFFFVSVYTPLNWVWNNAVISLQKYIMPTFKSTGDVLTLPLLPHGKVTESQRSLPWWQFTSSARSPNFCAPCCRLFACHKSWWNIIYIYIYILFCYNASGCILYRECTHPLSCNRDSATVLAFSCNRIGPSCNRFASSCS